MKKIEINKDWLYQKYWDEKLTMNQIAKTVSCSRMAIKNALQRYDISIRTHSEVNKINWQNPKYRLRQIKIRSGKNNFFYGKHHTKEARKKISIKNKKIIIESELLWALYWGKELSTSQIAKFFLCNDMSILNEMKRYAIPRRTRSEALKGRKISREHRRKISEAEKKFYQIPDNRNELSKQKKEFFKLHPEAHTGKNNPMYNRQHTKETKEKIGKMSKERWKDIELRSKLSEKQKIIWQNPKYKKEKSKISKKLWQNPEFIKKMMMARSIKPNKLEQKVDAILQKHFPKEWKYNGDFSCGVTIGSLIPDFININGKKSAIEVFGDYWHNPLLNSNVRWNRTYEGRKKIFEKYGWKLIVLWENEIKDENAEEVIVDRIQNG